MSGVCPCANHAETDPPSQCPKDSCPVKTEVQFALSHVWHARSAWKGSLDTVVARQYSKASHPVHLERDAIKANAS